jgi:hypothetical protein
MEDQRHYRVIHKKKTKVPTWGASITLRRERKRYLRTWKDTGWGGTFLRLGDNSSLKEKGKLNSPGDREIAHLLAPKDIRFAAKEKDKQHHLAERQLALERREDPLCNITARILQWWHTTASSSRAPGRANTTRRKVPPAWAKRMTCLVTASPTLWILTSTPGTPISMEALTRRRSRWYSDWLGHWGLAFKLSD